MAISLDDITHQPHDKRDFTWVGNAGVAIWVHREAVVNDKSLRLRTVNIFANANGNVDIVHVQLSGTTATVVKTQTVSCVTGLNQFEVDSSGVTLSTTTYIGVLPANGSTLKYKSTTGFSMFSFASSPGTIANNIFEISYWLGYNNTKYLPRVTGKLPLNEFTFADALANYDEVIVPSGDNNLAASVVVPVGKTIRGVRGKSRIVLASGITGLDINQAKDITIRDVNIVGTGSAVDISSSAVLSNAADVESLANMTAQKGIYLQGNQANDCLIDGVILENIDGIGLDIFNTTSSTPSISQGVTVNNVVAKNCYLGLRCAETGEYSVFNNFRAYANVIGLAVYGGNNYFTGGNLAYNRVGCIIGPGSNNSHGSIVNLSTNHCPLYGIYCYDIDFGFVFLGLSNWFSPIRIDNAEGLRISNSTIAQSSVQVVDTPHAELLDILQGVGVTVTATSSQLIQRNRRLYTTGQRLDPEEEQMLEIDISDTGKQQFRWSKASATFSTKNIQWEGQVAKAVTGAITFRETIANQHYYDWTYSASDRPSGASRGLLVLNDGSVSQAIPIVFEDIKGKVDTAAAEIVKIPRAASSVTAGGNATRTKVSASETTLVETIS